MGSRREVALLVVLVAIVFTLAVLLGHSGAGSKSDPRASTWLYTPLGTRALYEVLAEVDIPVSRRSAPLALDDAAADEDADELAADTGYAAGEDTADDAGEDSEEAAVEGEPAGKDLAAYVLLAPAEKVTPVELHALAEWVRKGGTLVYAARRQDPTLDTLGLRLASLTSDTTAYAEYVAEGESALPERAALTDGVAPVEGFRRAFDPASRALRRQPGAVLARVAGKPAVVDVPVGRGRVVAFADVRPLTNSRLRGGGAALLFARVAERARAGGGRVWFDEYHQGYGGDGSVTRTVLRFLGRRKAGHLALQLMLAGLGLLLLMGRRLGAPRPPPPARRRSPLEHVEALAGAYRQAGARATARRLLVAGLARRLGRRAPRNAKGEGEMLERLARGPGAGPAAQAMHEQWKQGQGADLVALSRGVDALLEEVRRK